jgi:hypothetical protein
MDENNVVTTDVTPDVEQTETVKTEPAKTEKLDNAELEKLKAALSRANSQAAEYKRALREKQTETERAEAERAEADKAMREELETLRKEKDISDTVSRSLALNIDADTSQKLAEAWNAHDKDSMFDCLKQFVEATTTRLNNEALNRQPGLSAGTPPTTNSTVDTDYENMRRWMGAPPRR